MSYLSKQIKNLIPYSISLFLALLIGRLFQLLYGSNTIYGIQLKTEYHIKGIIMDLMLAMLVCLVGGIISALVQLFFKRFYLFPLHILASIAILLNFVLIFYFVLTNQLVGDMFYQMTTDELITTASISSYISFKTLFYPLFMLCVYFLVGNWISKKSIANWTLIPYSVLILGATIAYPWKTISSEDYVGDMVINNKLLAFIGVTEKHFFDQSDFESIDRSSFQKLDDLFFTDPSRKNQAYPLLHEFPDSSILNNYLAIDPKTPPKIVIIIVESMSSFLIGNNPDNPCHFMPFMDSLSKQSLFFPNFMSTCERTHNVLPATLASLPNPPDGIITQFSENTRHLSLMSILKSYQSRFFCGVDLSFCNMENYLRYNQTDYLVHDWELQFSKTRDGIKSFWGYADDQLMDKVFLEDKKSTNKQPKLDVILTISTHEPYSYPNKSFYFKEINEHLKKYPTTKKQREEIEYHKETYGSFLFTDDALKKYFSTAIKQKDFNNTIYFILGDHGNSKFPRNIIQKYQTPLFIYSPLLKTKGEFKGMNSHLDLAPTILNFLRLNYPNLKISKVTPFMGRELDFNKSFKCNRALPLITADSDTKHLIYNNYYYYEGQLYEIQPWMKLKPVNDSRKKELIQKQLQLYKKLTKYLHEQDKILPESLFERNSNWGDKTIIFDTINQQWEKGMKDEYNNIGPLIKFNPRWKQVELILEGEIFISKPEDIEKTPVLTQIVENRKNKATLNYSVHKIKFCQPFKKKAWNTFRYSFHVDLRNINRLKQKCQLAYYLLNQEGSAMKLKNCHTSISVWK